MNYSKPMRIKAKQLLVSLVIVFAIGICLGVGITLLTINAKAVEEEPIQSEPTNFFTEKVQEQPIVSHETLLYTELPSEAFPDEEPVELPEESPSPELLGEWRITAYCACESCCGEWANNRPGGIVYGAAGIELQAGVSVASPLPLGTVVEVEGLGEYIVQDRTAKWVAEKYNGEVIDIYFSNHEEACEFGLQYKNVYLVKGVESND